MYCKINNLNDILSIVFTHTNPNPNPNPNPNHNHKIGLVHNQMCALAQNVGSHIAQPFVRAKTICLCYCCIPSYKLYTDYKRRVQCATDCSSLLHALFTTVMVDTPITSELIIAFYN